MCLWLNHSGLELQLQAGFRCDDRRKKRKEKNVTEGLSDFICRLSNHGILKSLYFCIEYLIH